MLANDILTGIRDNFLASVDHAEIVFVMDPDPYQTGDITEAMTIDTDETGIDSEGNVVIALRIALTSYNMRTIRVKKVTLYDENDNVLASKDEAIYMTISLLNNTLLYYYYVGVGEKESEDANGVRF